MTILINNRSGEPIYQQIYAQLRQQILSGALAEGEALPSIRSLAKDLRISVITTKRAYEELENSGLIYTLPGKGSFAAAGDPALLREDSLREIEEHMLAIRHLAASCGLRKEDLTEMYDLIMEEEV